MPVGSPGMEMGPRLDPYDVLLVQRDGRTSVFSHYPKSNPKPEGRTMTAKHFAVMAGLWLSVATGAQAHAGSHAGHGHDTQSDTAAGLGACQR